MSALAGWGFLPDAELRRSRNGYRLVSRAELEFYAAMRRTKPGWAEVAAHFRCSRASAFRHRATVLQIMDARKRA